MVSLKMKSLKFLYVLNFFILWDSAYTISVEDVVAKSVEVVKPHHCVLWTNLFDGEVNKSKHLKNYQLFLKNLLSKTPTLQRSMNKSAAFVPGKYVYDVNISAPIHYIYFISQDYADKDKNKILGVLKQIFFSIMYMSTPKFLLVFHQSNESDDQLISYILKTARKNNFVDFVILQVIQNKSPILFLNNFVSGKIEKHDNISRDLRLFPDSIKNMGGYNLRVGVPTYWSYLKKNSERYPAHLAPHSRLDKSFEYFLQSLNTLKL